MACRSCKSSLGLLPRSTTSSSPLSSNLLRPGFVVDTGSQSCAAANAAGRTFSQSTHTSQSQHYQQVRRLHATRQCRDDNPKPKFSLGRAIRESVGLGRLNTYVSYGITERLVKQCIRQADYTISKELRKNEAVPLAADGEEIGESTGESIWHDNFHLPPTFSTWSHVTMLHMYLLVVRLRCMEKDTWQLWQNQLVDHFFHEAEVKMDMTHDLSSRTLRQRYLRDLFTQWRGVVMAYDEGLVKGDAVMAAAVWRNVFKAREDVDVRALAAIVSWMRSCLKVLERQELEDLTFITSSLFAKRVLGELAVVDIPSNSLPSVAAVAPQPAIAAGKVAAGKKSADPPRLSRS
ncbi:ubiquinol-cytochrome C chaperone-domain-containing protein [Apodospora peruviana]|uniref:Ubiquinol-cytochrome C chaperone-domain-containing protein n=1 Tax=Apodospora peruviana TaxID=516989 RepID=A0AAE0ICL4_9PEZI|nr:ubiquinol-cytochrome C chaperone-domain-containing protein [Apodospora peruviana]